MQVRQKLTLLIMDPPYESANTATAFRLMDAAIKKGIDLTVFAYEGATALSFSKQLPHANPVKGTCEKDEKHPLTKDFVTDLFRAAAQKGTKFEWINCGLCVDERGVGEWVEGCMRGGPAQFVQAVKDSNKVLVIATSR